jgi:hypothetical protein
MGSGAGPPPKPPGRPVHDAVVASSGRRFLGSNPGACSGAGYQGRFWCVSNKCADDRDPPAVVAPPPSGDGRLAADDWIGVYRAIRTGQLHGLPHFHTRPVNVLVLHGPRGDLVLRRVSRLDAFSGYPVHTWLPGRATGVTTGAPEVCPSRSSRTRDSASQISFTHGR